MPSSGSPSTDLVNAPAHYTVGRKFEVIDVIEDNICRAPNSVLGNCQSQNLRYILRLWDKDDPLLNAKKARWYLDRLIQHLESEQAAELYKRLEDNPPAFDDPLE